MVTPKAPEFPAARFSIPQMTPEQPFRNGHSLPQGPGARPGHEPLLTPASPRSKQGGEGEEKWWAVPALHEPAQAISLWHRKWRRPQAAL